MSPLLKIVHIGDDVTADLPGEEKYTSVWKNKAIGFHQNGIHF